MIEQQIDKKILAAELEMVLVRDERKAFAKLQQEIFDPADQGSLDVAFVRRLPQRQEIEVIRSFRTCCARSEVSGGKHPAGIVQCLALLGTGFRVDLLGEHIPAPAVLECGSV